ncbi:MAG: hypothetical protein CMI90_03295 [Pelagibacteraceae bacterium]|nr:hypothetical protein [Pelagibacteraceae bacterium]|tara:strand:- start:197 stop:1207 length:1011 start_codon:yes stop_codon:yes gene_type:complete
MNYLHITLLFFIGLNLILILNFSKFKLFHYNIDKPDNLRKLHLKPTPLAGGLILLINILIYWILANISNDILKDDIFFQNIKSLNIFILIVLSIFSLGFIDDKLNLKANTKFFFLLIIVLSLLFLDKNLILENIIFSFYKKDLALNELSIFFSVFCFIVFINAFNMFDGINLQSSSYSLFIFLNILFFYNSLFIKILIIALLAFSYLNLKNKTFLGDSGSLLLAFIISYFFIKLYNFNYIEFADQICLYMIIPGLDLVRLFIVRIYNKKNPLSSDRLHLHHLLISRFSLTKTLFTIHFLIFIPVILGNLNMNNIYVFLFTTFIYSATVIYIKKIKN